MIEVENLSKRYGEKLAVDGLGFVVQPGMIAGLDEPTAGRVRVNGFALVCGYAAILIGAGAWRLRRSDA